MQRPNLYTFIIYIFFYWFLIFIFASQTKGRLAGQGTMKIICDRLTLGDWFLIYQLGHHMEPIVYSEFLKDLALEFQNTAPTLERKPMLMSQ